jgi:hypothetical protein
MWKVGGPTGLTRIVQLATSYPLQIAVLQIHRDPDRWARFYAQATKFRATAREELGKPLWYLDGSEVLRMFLMGEAFAHAVGRLLRARYPWGERHATVELELVVDTDLREAETREQFKWALLDWTKNSRLHLDLDVSCGVTGRVETEQEEPLLLLPDYIAGVYHHADPRARLRHPIATRGQAAEVVEQLRNRLGSHLHETAEDFRQEYPLDHDSGRVVQRRQPSG